MYGVLSQIEAQLSLKNAWLPPIFFLDTKSTYEDLFYLHSVKPRKNIPALVSIGDRKAELVSGDAQNVCAITIVDTVLKNARSKNNITESVKLKTIAKMLSVRTENNCLLGMGVV